VVLRPADVDHLRCPACREELRFRGYVARDRLDRGELICTGCSASYQVFSGIAELYREDEVRGGDRAMRIIYDRLAILHDPLVRFSFPLALGESEASSRARYLERLELAALAREVRGGRPARILEIGAGTGSNVPLLRARLPSGLAAELWAVDLSMGMLRLLAQRMRFLGDAETRFAAADAHALPFPDGFFDRVFHVGGIAGYRDPGRALAEMVRVARPDTPILVVDERLDPDRPHSLFHRLFFRWVTIYDRDPHVPVEHLPANARDVRIEQVGRFFYGLTFRVGARTSERKPRRRAPAKPAAREGRPPSRPKAEVGSRSSVPRTVDSGARARRRKKRT
jgi:SAM-dependent methyltransferase